MEFKKRFNAWQRSQQGMEYERQRTSFLTTAQIPQNPPGLFTPTQVRCLRSFFIAGKRIEPGQVVSIEYHIAESLKAIGKVEYIT